MSCNPIINLSLDEESKAALGRIKKQQNIAKTLGSAISVGVFSSIFTKSKVTDAAINISQTDWELYTKAMASLPIVQKKVIQKEVGLMIMHYQIGNYDHKHVQFWMGMKNACK